MPITFLTEPAALPKPPAFLVIDLDGTMVDSVPDLVACVNQMQRDVGLPERSEAQVRTWVGNGVEKLVARALANDLAGEISDVAFYERALEIFRHYYREQSAVNSKVYPGVREGLSALSARFPLVCVTNKAAEFTEPLLETLGLRAFFRLVVSGDSLPHKKPHPAPLLHAAEFLHFSPQSGVMVGDSQSDVKAARAALMPVVCLRDGYNHGEDIARSHPDVIIDVFDELLALFP
jgi:phosphoglycolate phosphatase